MHRDFHSLLASNELLAVCLKVMTSLIMHSALVGVGSFLDSFFCHQGRQVGNAAAIAPFVIVPGKNFGHFAFQHHGR